MHIITFAWNVHSFTHLINIFKTQVKYHCLQDLAKVSAAVLTILSFALFPEFSTRLIITFSKAHHSQIA